MKHLILPVILLLGLFCLGAKPVRKEIASVKKLRGDVKMVDLDGSEGKLGKDSFVTAGSKVVTGKRSFVQIVFTQDKSTMNIGPNSQMVIEKFGGDQAGVIHLVKGKIRSEVSKAKDYFKTGGEQKSKMFVKTQNAVMGIRGTDFMITSNGENTAAVLFEGKVKFNRLDNVSMTDANQLEAVVDRGENIKPREFSVVEKNLPPTVPSIMNTKQFENLEKNKDFGSGRKPSSTQASASENTKSVVPKGLKGTVVANDPKGVKVEASAPRADVSTGDAAGYVKGDKVKPASGSFVHLDSGKVIAPSKNSVFDKNSGSFIASADSGTVDDSGNYVPPKGMKITEKGEMQVEVRDPNSGKVVNKVVKIPPPVIQEQSPSLVDVAQREVASNNVSSADTEVKNDQLDPNFVQNGVADLSITESESSGSVSSDQAAQQRTSSRVNINTRVADPN